jgi:GT2 family glycosyltransferase
MNIAHPDKIVVLGFLSHFPVAGVAWQTIHYLAGFHRLGYEVFYVEAHGCTPSKLMQSDRDDGATRAAAYIEHIMRRIGLEHSWAYHSLYDSRYFGLSEAQLRELYQSAALLINLHGSHLPAVELAATGRLIYLETDPVDVEIDLFHQRAETLQYLSPHCAFFSFGENLGSPDCLVPVPKEFRFIPTRQPVVMDFWEEEETQTGDCFTTIGNWRQPWRECNFKQEVYRWSKHLEFQKFLDLPARTSQPFELALSSFNEEDRKLLESNGWRVQQALELSGDLDVYRAYIAQSRGEFTVAKDQNVRLRSGWFSDRAATYLAAGRPVINQDTGFSNHLPTGHGLFSFSTIEDVLGAVDCINSDYERHRRSARNIARDYFSYDVVLTKLVRELGLEVPKRAPAAKSALPSNLLIVPVSRWPTRLAESTVEAALALAAPQPVRVDADAPRRSGVSVILVTHNGLPYTKLCLATLLGAGWRQEDQLIIVDNASSDGTRDYLLELAKENSWIQILFNEVNRGFAAANNQAFAKANGDILVFLNPDTLVTSGWQSRLSQWLEDVSVGMVGPVTNRTCNEAQIDAPYRTYGELEQFAAEYTRRHVGETTPVAMLALFCAAIRRETFELVGPLDERFELGMFEDDDYGRRLRQAGYKVLCAEDVFVHHFGQGSFGELCSDNHYDLIFDGNRRRFEEKWGIPWKPHARRITPEYSQLRQRIHAASFEHLPAGSTVAIISKGDDELINLRSHRAWHFPQSTDGAYANIYPADGTEAVAQLEAIHAKGARFLLIPQPAYWWLDYYRELKTHLESRCRLALRQEETCLIFDLERTDE